MVIPNDSDHQSRRPGVAAVEHTEEFVLAVNERVRFIDQQRRSEFLDRPKEHRRCHVRRK